jgi:hypothetical protein
VNNYQHHQTRVSGVIDGVARGVTRVVIACEWEAPGLLDWFTFRVTRVIVNISKVRGKHHAIPCSGDKKQ